MAITANFSKKFVKTVDFSKDTVYTIYRLAFLYERYINGKNTLIELDQIRTRVCGSNIGEHCQKKAD